MPPSFIDLLAQRGPTSARELLTALSVSQPTFSRLVAAAGPRVLRIGRARATRYALRRDVPGEGNSWPVYRIVGDGRPFRLATLHAVAPRGWWFEVAGARPAWLRGDFADGLFDGLPWMLGGLRLEGFLGRAFARVHGATLGLSPDPTRWSDDDALRALLRFGDDLPGDIVVGDIALRRFLEASRAPGAIVAGPDRGEHYDELANAAMAGDITGSSAGGEQPKFCVHGEGATSLLVKFSPPRDSRPGRRWADLLVCEHLASSVLREHGIAASKTALFETASRTYLEVERFDRVGESGRNGFVSLLSLDAAHYGMLDNWSLAADRLECDGWLASSDANTLRILHWFGIWIANTDMHFANAGLVLADELPLRLAPSYDMLPMHYRPASSGEVTTPPFTFPAPLPAEVEVAARAAEMARLFWHRASSDERISPEFRITAAGIGGAVTIAR